MSFPPTEVVDNFQRTEGTLSHGGKWAAVTGAVGAGDVVNPVWLPSEGYPNEYAARWTVRVLTSSAVALQTITLPGNEERYFGVWACLRSESKSGYLVRALETASAGTFTVTIEKWVAGTKTILLTTSSTITTGDYLGITVGNAVIGAWRYHTEWVALGEASDKTYSAGFAGIIAMGNKGSYTNFTVEEQATKQSLKAKLTPWNTGSVTAGLTDLDRYTNAVTSIFAPVAEVAAESGTQGEGGWVPGYGNVFNPETCPADFLPWLGQLVGVSVPSIATEAEARALVKEEAGLNRGTLASVEIAIERVLGSVPFRVLERTNVNLEEKAYHFVVFVPTGKSSTALKTAIEEKKPGGVLFTIVEGEGWVTGIKEEWLEIATAKWTELVEGDY